MTIYINQGIQAVPESALGAPNGVATLTGTTLTSSQVPPSVVSAASAYAAGSIGGIWAPAPSGDATGVTDTTNLAVAYAAAQTLGGPLNLQQGLYQINTTSSTLFAQGTGTPTQLLGRAAGYYGAYGTSIKRVNGTLPIWTVTGTGDTPSTRGYPFARDIEFTGHNNTSGDLVVFSRVSNSDLMNVRFDSNQGRLLRLFETWNGRFDRCYFTNGGSTSTSITGCSWSTSTSVVTVPGTNVIPANSDNLIIYGVGIPYGTVIQSWTISGGNTLVTISNTPTIASSSSGLITISGAPAISLEGVNSDSPGTGASAVNDFIACEWETNADVDIDLCGSPDGTAQPTQKTKFTGGKQERQVAANNAPVVHERYATDTTFASFSMNPGGNTTAATASLNSSTAMTLSASNASVAIGQQVNGLGLAPSYTIKINGISGSSTPTPLGPIPFGGTGPLNSPNGSYFSGVTTGMPVTGTNVPSGTTVSAVTATSISFSNPLSGDVAGQDIVINGTFVSAVNGTAVTLSLAAIANETSQKYTFGGSLSRHIVKPGYGFSTGTTTLAGVSFDHSGCPDFFIAQLVGKISTGAITFNSGTPIVPTAYWWIGQSISAGAAALPTRGSFTQYPTRLFLDQSGTNTAFQYLPVEVKGFDVNGTVTAPTKVGPTLVWQMPDSNTSTLHLAIPIPADLAPSGEMTVCAIWGAGSATSGSPHFRLSLGIPTNVALSSATMTDASDSTNRVPSSTAGGIAPSAIDLQLTVSLANTGNPVPGNLALCSLQRVVDGSDTLSDVVNILGVWLWYQRA